MDVKNIDQLSLNEQLDLLSENELEALAAFTKFTKLEGLSEDKIDQILQIIDSKEVKNSNYCPNCGEKL